MNFRADVHHDLLPEPAKCPDCGFALISHPIVYANWRCDGLGVQKPAVTNSNAANTATEGDLTPMPKTVPVRPRIITLTVRRLREMARQLDGKFMFLDIVLRLREWADELNAQHASTGRTDKSQAARRRKAKKAVKQ